MDFWLARGADILDFGQADQKRPVTADSVLLHMEGPASRQGRWWLLDIETSGIDPVQDDIIALRLACLEDRVVREEREVLVRPRRPLRPWAEQLTGIANQDLEQAISLQEAADALEALDAPLVLLDRDFGLPFLQNAFSLCGREFCLPCLLLDRLAALLLGCSPKQRTERFLAQLPPPAGWESGAPRDRYLCALYQLTLAAFARLEEAGGPV